MLIRRKKQVTLQRALAFMKRLSVLSIHVLPNASVGLLAACRANMHVSVRMCASTTSRPLRDTELRPFSTDRDFDETVAESSMLGRTQFKVAAASHCMKSVTIH